MLPVSGQQATPLQVASAQGSFITLSQTPQQVMSPVITAAAVPGAEVSLLRISSVCLSHIYTVAHRYLYSSMVCLHCLGHVRTILLKFYYKTKVVLSTQYNKNMLGITFRVYTHDLFCQLYKNFMVMHIVYCH